MVKNAAKSADQQQLVEYYKERTVYDFKYCGA
jgi:hypothetical protein